MATILALAASLGACGGDDKDSDGSSGASGLDGTWVEACGTDGSPANDESQYDTATLVFAGTKATKTTITYSDKKCQTKSHSGRIIATIVDSGKAVSKPDGALSLDTKLDEMYVTPLTDDLVATLNGTLPGGKPFCGGGFVKDVEKQIVYDACDADDRAGSPDTVDYGIYKIDGTTLYDGDSGDPGDADDGSTPDKRPTAFAARTYSRQ
jgi:hypothetical protein